LENTMQRAVLIATGDEIDTDSVILTEAVPLDEDVSAGSLVGHTVADVEKNLIIDTL